MNRMPQGVILYEGPSRVTGEPIVAIATGLVFKSKNVKTKNMAQTYILCRDIMPTVALRTGQDEDVCGRCVFRMVEGNGACYVDVGSGPTMVWKAYKDGVYPHAEKHHLEYIRENFHVRFGAYGDPAAVSSKVWRGIMPSNPRHSTGYTHDWRRNTSQHYKKFLMASVESEAQAEEAIHKGWRPFYVVALDREIPEGFAQCPDDDLFVGKKVGCEDCGACNGLRGGASKPIAIFAHGQSATSVKAPRRRRPTHQANKKITKEGVAVRVPPELHVQVKPHARSMGMTLKAWLEMAIVNQMKADKKGNRNVRSARGDRQERKRNSVKAASSEARSDAVLVS